MLTMNRSRLAMKTPTHTIRETAHFRCMATRLSCMTKRTLAQELHDATQGGMLVAMLGSDYKTQACSIAGALKVLQARLQKLIDQGVLERTLYQERPPRHEYRLTEKGVDLWPIVVSLMQWGDRHTPPPDGPAVVLEHRGCGGRVDEHRICERCGTRLSAYESRALPGPGAAPDHPLLARGHARVAA